MISRLDRRIVLASIVLSLSAFSGRCIAQAPTPIVADGASFTGPKGWDRLASDKPKTKAWFISPGSDPKAPKAMIMVDVGTPRDPDLPAIARTMAANWGGKVLDQKTSLGGVEALHVRVDKPGAGMRPVEGVLAIRNGKLYLLMGGVTPGQAVAREVEEVRKGWKWVR